MELKNVMEFIKKNKELLKELKDTASDVISDVKSLSIEENTKRAQQFVKALDQGIQVGGLDERLAALDEAIRDLEEKGESAGMAMQMAIDEELAVLHTKQADLKIAKGFISVVAFTEEDKNEIQGLLKEAQKDIQARKNLKTAIDITTKLIALATNIAKKGATGGIA